MNNLDLIRQKCIEANPESFECSMGTECLHHVCKKSRPIRLADCLLAIGKIDRLNVDVPQVVFVSARGYFSMLTEQHTIDVNYGKQWNLKLDDLTKQSEETITFLADLLK